MRLNEIAMSTINRHKKVINAINNANIPYLEIWFHGSRARGDNKPSSDWDYLVILDDLYKKNYVEYIKILTNLKPFSKAHIQPELKSSTLRAGSVGWWAKKEGVLIN